MKKLYWFFIVVLLLISCAKSKLEYHENSIGNMYLRNGKVYFQKEFLSHYGQNDSDNSLEAGNTPFGGIQINLRDEQKINGVIFNSAVDWETDGKMKLKVPEKFKYPSNATFEIRKQGNAYDVIVSNIWFSELRITSKEKNITIESLIAKKDGLAFKNDKQTIQIIHLLGNYYSGLFGDKMMFKEKGF